MNILFLLVLFGEFIDIFIFISEFVYFVIVMLNIKEILVYGNNILLKVGMIFFVDVDLS